jgi:predicted nucleic acid-binding protein
VATEPALVYADSSALAKLVVEEPETQALQLHLAELDPQLTSSRLAVVEVTRTVKVASPGTAGLERLGALFERVLLVDITEDLIDAAAELTSSALRTLDAVHLATALGMKSNAMIAYDQRLLAGARQHGIAVVSPC